MVAAASAEYNTITCSCSGGGVGVLTLISACSYDEEPAPKEVDLSPEAMRATKEKETE